MVEERRFRFLATLPPVDSGYDGNLTVPLHIASVFLGRKVTRIRLEIEGWGYKSGAINSRGDGTFYVYLNKEERKQLHALGKKEISVVLTPDESKYGMPMPAELLEALSLYPKGSEHFERLTPGRQRSIIYTVSKPKSEAIRIKKAILVLEYLEEVRGNMDVREMGKWMKGK
ncbi:MAG: YdeI/OmpD-associated family protein [Saprospiraceae bacterium]|nr:YdeI/OmpD-associated family protein [Saprospiraceae bacterium]